MMIGNHFRNQKLHLNNVKNKEVKLFVHGQMISVKQINIMADVFLLKL